MAVKGAFRLLPDLLKAALEEKGITTPTEPQEKAIPVILSGKNALLIAPTGTGKTEAALLPMLARLMPSRGTLGVKLLYITPLRALNRDLMLRISWWVGRLDMTVGVRHGDTPPTERRTQTLRPPDVLVTTPETLQILLVAKRFREHLRSTRCVIVDEVHELAESKRGAQLALALERLKLLTGEHPQIVGLSATIGSPQAVAEFLTGSSPRAEVIYVPASKAMSLRLEYPQPSPADVELASKLYTVPEVAARLRRIREFIGEAQTTLIFTNTRSMAEILGSRLRMWEKKLAMAVHHGSLAAKARISAERALREGQVRSVVSTSSLELGIDIGHIDLVIQYMSPRQATRLVQRVGRSGHRVGEVSRGVVVVMTPDDALESTVICSKALREELEPVNIPSKPLDALLHELIALLMWKPEWSVSEALDLIRRAYNYRDLNESELLALLHFLSQMPREPVLISFGGAFRRGPGFARMFPYYFENLSMIPEVKTYTVVDQDTEEPIGTLDEPFVAERGEPGSKFIMAGEVWRIAQIFKDRVYVARDPDPEGAVPHWLGEEIPVPFSISQEVGKIRDEVDKLAMSGIELREIAESIAKFYGVPVEPLMPALRPTYETSRLGLPVPTHERVVIESAGKTTIIHVHAGTLANRALARYLAEIMAKETGSAVSVAEDPYRIYLTGPLVSPDIVAKAIKSPPADVGETLLSAVERSGYFRFRLVQAARKMGVLSSDVEVTPSLVTRLLEGLRDTPVYLQAMRDVLERDLSVPGAESVLQKISSREWEVVSRGRVDRLTPIGEDALRWISMKLETIPPEKRRLLRRERLRVKLLSETRTLACLRCRGYVEEVELYLLPQRPTCPICGSSRLGVIDAPEFLVERALRASDSVLRTNKRLARIWRELKRTSEFVEKYGRLAILALVSRLPRKALLDALKRSQGSETTLLEVILERERERLRFRESPGGG
ncbi:MAG TPA: DEAD/DEAH box helicase [Candidatus Korarchaeota archaeon]|nr:DEAD/DEAH box helicase [Candidatus Korarchaeota archaeon]